mmetsp:Transcript_44328/g.142767  ORF Transcript_44328/g.142767 Transcript_44328/m.142767 type:complete len:209 (+) Transcript_44328:589-1215(+)
MARRALDSAASWREERSSSQRQSRVCAWARARRSPPSSELPQSIAASSSQVEGRSWARAAGSSNWCSAPSERGTRSAHKWQRAGACAGEDPLATAAASLPIPASASDACAASATPASMQSPSRPAPAWQKSRQVGISEGCGEYHSSSATAQRRLASSWRRQRSLSAQRTATDGWSASSSRARSELQRGCGVCKSSPSSATHCSRRCSS